ncbi:MAG: sensor histidine kinase, partial [Halobacteriaceae archaeon]
VGFQEDVTERKQAEQEANVLLEQFEEFGSVLAHDLQKPLSKARGRVELARQTEAWDELEKADDALTRLNSLLDEFAEVMQEGQIVTDSVDIDLRRISESVAQSVLPDAASVDVVGDPQIRADKRAVRRLVENLFSNAVEHGESDVTIRVGETTDGFYVADDGPGIPVDQRDEVFTPGYTTRNNGAGMGLTSVRQIVMAHGWDITITESQSGGARFEITTHNQSTQPLDTVNKIQV